MTGGWDAAGPTGLPYEAPRNPVEELLAGIGADLLDVERVGIHEDFFACGGDSLLAERLVSRINASLPVLISLRDVFEAPRVAGLAALLAERSLTTDEARLSELLADLEIQ